MEVSHTGFSNLDFSAFGVLDGTQKLGKSLDRPSAMFEIDFEDDGSSALNAWVGLLTMLFSDFKKLLIFLLVSSATLISFSSSSFFFNLSYSFSFRLCSFFLVMMYCRMTSLSKRYPSFLKVDSLIKKFKINRINLRYNRHPAWL